MDLGVRGRFQPTGGRPDQPHREERWCWQDSWRGLPCVLCPKPPCFFSCSSVCQGDCSTSPPASTRRAPGQRLFFVWVPPPGRCVGKGALHCRKGGAIAPICRDKDLETERAFLTQDPLHRTSAPSSVKSLTSFFSLFVLPTISVPKEQRREKPKTCAPLAE